MKKLEIEDLMQLSESDQQLLFNYFGAISGVAHRRKMAIGSALAGCLLIGMAYLLEAVLLEVPSTPEWLPILHWFTKIFPAVLTPILVFVCLWIGRSHQREAHDLQNELVKRGFDVSGLTQEDVFEHVAMPMFRRSGLRIKE